MHITVNSLHTQLAERFLILIHSLDSPLYDDILLQLHEPNIILLNQSTDVLGERLHDIWTLLICYLIEALSPLTPQVYVLNTALAMGCYNWAVDLLDDIEDQDNSAFIQRVGIPRALNTATALIFLAGHTLSSLSEYGIPPEQILHMLTVLHQAGLQATNGQHKDLCTEADSLQTFAPESCITIAAGKSGAGLQLAFQLSAICAAVNEDTYKSLSEFALLIGIYIQLDDDAHDLYQIIHSDEVQKEVDQGEILLASDIKKNKKTLPLVLAAQELQVDTIQDSLSHADTKERTIKVLDEAIMATLGISLYYKEQAQQILKDIEDQVSLPKELLDLLHF